MRLAIALTISKLNSEQPRVLPQLLDPELLRANKDSAVQSLLGAFQVSSLILGVSR